MIYTRPHKRKLAKRSRTLPVFGKGDDEGKYFRCWNCGFICNKDRDELGDAESNAGDDHTDYHGNVSEYPYANHYDDIASKVCCLGESDHYHVVLELGPDGEPKTIIHDLTSDISRGCPFCGTVNWRGDY
ncbi:hypothetical protein KAX02_02990 [candidate division WOR-3 bacterium]|nr:hypothetical protein [candidate division WOR-3 bacterium]